MKIWDVITSSLILIITTSAIVIHSHMLINWDVSFLMEATRRFLAGGTYTQNFYETNTPMILYLYVPPVLLGVKYLGLTKSAALIVYVMLLSLLTLYFCHRILFKLMLSEGLNCVILSTIAVILLLLPTYEFGQREHLLMILTMPYLLYMVARTQNLYVSRSKSIIIGVMAGLGFAIKPFFSIVFVFIEFYYILKQRNIYACLRTETFIMLFVFFCYCMSINLLFPDYLRVVVPVLFHLYYPGFGLPLIELIFNEKIIYCLIVLAAFCLWRHFKADSHPLYDILALAMVGYLLVFVLEGTHWFYHILPAFGITVLLCSILIYTHNKNIYANASIFNLVFSGILAYFICYTVVLTYQNTYPQMLWAQNSSHIQMMAFLKQYPERTTYSLISTKAVIFRVIDNANLLSVSRFPNYWWLPGIIKLKRNSPGNKENKLLDNYLNYFIGLVSEDFVKNHPRLVFVDVAPYNTELQSNNINYISMLTNNESFRKIWSHYHYITRFKFFDVYEYQNNVK